jgi:hypothetical protein
MRNQKKEDTSFAGRFSKTALLLLVLAILSGGPGIVAAQMQSMTAPKPTVAELFTLEGEFVRIAYNNEGYSTLGYRIAQDQLGRHWFFLETGLTLREHVKDQTIKRTAFTVTTPAGKTIQMASQEDFAKAGYLPELNMMAQVDQDSINYFPTSVSQPCALRFFGPPGTLSYDQTDLSYERGCFGRLYFNIPDTVTPGQYWLNIKLAASSLQVPFRIFTKDEEKVFRKKWESLKKQHDDAMKMQ